MTCCAALAAACPTALIRFGVRRNKELELRTNLRHVATAIDHYVDLRMKDVIKRQPKIGQNIYPKDLERVDEADRADRSPTRSSVPSASPTTPWTAAPA